MGNIIGAIFIFALCGLGIYQVVALLKDIRKRIKKKAEKEDGETDVEKKS